MWRAASSFVPHLTLADASTQRPHRCRQGLNRRAHRRVLRRLVLDQSPAPPSHSVRLFRSPLQLARSPHERSYTLIQLRYSGDVLVEEPKLRPWTSALVRAGSASPDRHAPHPERLVGNIAAPASAETTYTLLAEVLPAPTYRKGLLPFLFLSPGRGSPNAPAAAGTVRS